MNSTRPDPAKYIPPEIWSIIFEMVELSQRNENGIAGSKDIFNCYRTCVTFYNILEATKSNWLFKQVVHVIACYLNGPDFLSCRATCKSWKQDIDYYLENGDKCWLETDAYRDKICKYNRFKDVRSSFTPFSNVSAFLDVMRNHMSGCPFPGRSLSLSSDTQVHNPSQIQTFWETNTLEILTNFGCQVYNLQITVAFECSIPALNSYLQLLPNLKILCLEGRYDFYNSNVSLHPLPNLESLHFIRKLPQLKTNLSNVLPIGVQHHIVSHYLQQLKRLRICLVDPTATRYAGFECFSHNLEEIEVTISSAPQLYKLFPPRHGRCTKVLKRITIQIARVWDLLSKTSNRLGNVLRPILSFSQCLTHLVILNNCSEFWQASQVDIDTLKYLTHLKTLHIDGFCFLRTYIFPVLPASLQFIHLNGFKNQKEGDKLSRFISLDVQKEEAVLEGGVIWQRLPNLKELSVRDIESDKLYVYYREIKLCQKCKANDNDICSSAQNIATENLSTHENLIFEGESYKGSTNNSMSSGNDLSNLESSAVSSGKNNICGNSRSFTFYIGLRSLMLSCVILCLIVLIIFTRIYGSQ